jgi:Tfp pilus assembly protein PilO
MRRGENIWARRAGLLVFSALALLSNLGFFLWYRATVADRQKALESQKTAMAKDVAEAEKEASRLAVQRDRLSQVSSAVSEFYASRIGPRRESLAPMVAEIHDVLVKAGVNPSQISYATLPLADLPLVEMTISFSFKKDYSKFKQLVAAFESDPRWIVVRDVGLSRDPDVPGGVSVHLRLVTYFASPEASPIAHPRTVPTGARE